MRQLGSAGPTISVVGFGSWEAGGEQWGPNESERSVIEAIKSSIDSGMTWIDTAEVYGKGESERLVGKAIRGRREEVRVFSKVAPSDEGSGFLPEQVRAAVGASLRRLGTDFLDLYQLHWPDESGVPIEETWGKMAELVDEGLVRHIGVSNFDRSLIDRCQRLRHVDSLQNELSLLIKRDVPDLLAWLRERGIGYLAYGPLGSGILTGALRPDTTFSDSDWRSGADWQDEDWETKFGPESYRENVRRAEELREIAEDLGATPPVVALRWVIDQPGVTAAIAGSRNGDHVRDNASAGDLKLDPETIQRIEHIFAT